MRPMYIATNTDTGAMRLTKSGNNAEVMQTINRQTFAPQVSKYSFF